MPHFTCFWNMELSGTWNSSLAAGLSVLLLSVILFSDLHRFIIRMAVLIIYFQRAKTKALRL